MQQQRWSSVVAFGLLLLVAAEAITLRSARDSVSVDEEEFNQAEGEDRSFWAQEWASVEQELKQLNDAAMATLDAFLGKTTKPQDGVVLATTVNAFSALQLTANGPEKKEDKTSAAAAAAAAAAPAAKNLVKEAKKTEKKAEESPEDVVKRLKSALKKTQSPTSALAKAGFKGGKLDLGNLLGKEAGLATMLSMLKGLYQQGRERIGDLNKREKEQKEKFAKKVAEHERRMKHIQNLTVAHNQSLSAEYRANETKEETRMFTYWQHCRDRQHKQYHNMLRIQHGTMEREKQMIDMYEKTLSGKTPQDKVKVAKQLSEMTGGVGGGMPEVVLIQKQVQSVVRFCQDSLAEVSQDRAELNVAWRPEAQKRKSTSLLQRAKHSLTKKDDPAVEAAKVEAQNLPDETEFDASQIQIPADPRAQKPIDTSNGVVDSSVYDNNNDEVYDMTGQGFHILSRHQNTQEAIAERNLAEVNKLSR